MPNAPEVDVQAQAILTGLESLANFLENPLARDALDLAEKTGRAQTHAHYDLLRRIRKSLSQYLKRHGDLFYVGLLGHYSSGKSSTINSLLQLWSTQNERPTDQNPTDTTITLITQEDNIKSLLGVIKEGTVTIRSQAINNQLLESVVLADTPGTGDPHLIQEIARDFLPICDVILFFFSAASPLDQTDIPLLTELHKQLPFIPLRFIVTRADEFATESGSTFDIDKVKQSRFLDGLLPRLNKLLEPAKYTAEDLILIDNKKRYNIGNLVDLIKNKCDPSDPHSRIAMHGYKIRYFFSAAKELKQFFSAFLDEKLRELNKIVATASQNIDLYNANVRISNNHLTQRWHEQLGAVRAARETSLKTATIQNRLPSEANAFDSAIKTRTKIATDHSGEAHIVWQHLTTRFKLDLSEKVNRRILELDTERAFDVDSGSVSSWQLGPITVDLQVVMPLISSVVRFNWNVLRDVKAAALRDAASTLRRLIENLVISITARSPLAQCDEQVQSGKNSLSDDLTSFFRNVELYRDGVFSHTTKESISTLGIGGQLDDLEQEFTEKDKANFTSETMEKLFPNFSEMSAKALTGLSELDAAMRPISLASKEIKIPSPDLSVLSIDSFVKDETTLLGDAIVAELQDGVELLKSKLQVRLAAIAATVNSSYRAALRAARRTRNIRLFGMAIGAGILAALACFGFFYLRKPVEHNLFDMLALEIVAGLFVALLTYIFGKAVDNFPKTSGRIKNEHQAILRDRFNSAIAEEMGTYQFAAIEHASLTERLKTTYNRLVQCDPDGWNQIAEERLAALRELDEATRTVQGKYVQQIEEVVNSVSAYFSNASRNLELLYTVADTIKEKAIQPSFDLLARTRETLKSVKDEIGSIEFS